MHEISEQVLVQIHINDLEKIEAQKEIENSVSKSETTGELETTDEKKGKKKNNGPSSVIELTLLHKIPDYKVLVKYMDLARLIYNACLGESLKRLKKVKRDPLYKKTVKLNKKDEKQNEMRKKNFKFLNEKYGFNDYSIQSFAIKCKNDSKFIDQLGVHVIQKIATRAFRAVQKVAFKKAKKVRFKRKGELVTLEGKNNTTFLRYTNGYAVIGDLTIACNIRKNDKVFEHFLKHEIKFCRLVTRKHKGKHKFFLQIVYKGQPYKKIELGTEHTCLDVGPSTIAKVNKKEVALKKFCDDVVSKKEEIKKLQKKASRKLRLLNPQNYDEKGAVIKGSKKWNKSKGYIKLQDEIADMQRRLAASRKCAHNREINIIISQSKKVSAEKLSYKAFQKLYGSSVAACAPGYFMDKLEKKIKFYGGKFQHINTYKTKLSQTCICGKVQKKTLNERTHKCECGVVMQRDIFSAYLGLFVSAKDEVKLNQAKKQYKNYLPVMEKCLSDLEELAKEHPEKIATSFGIKTTPTTKPKKFKKRAKNTNYRIKKRIKSKKIKMAKKLNKDSEQTTLKDNNNVANNADKINEKVS